VVVKLGIPRGLCCGKSKRATLVSSLKFQFRKVLRSM